MRDEHETILPRDLQYELPTTDTIDIDEAYERINPFGRFQILLLIAIVCEITLLSYQMSVLYFIGYNPPWTCVYSNNNTSQFCAENYGLVIRVGSVNFSARCKLSRDEWEYTSDRYTSFTTEFDLVCDKSTLASLAGSFFFFGSAISAFIVGTCADILGRKPIFLFTYIIAVASSVAMSYITQIWQLMVLRFVNGASAFVCVDISIVIMSEYVTKKWRPVTSNICLISQVISSLLNDLVAYYKPDWRFIERYLGLPSLIFFVVLLFMPESPRWLLGANKVEKCERLLITMAKVNGKTINLRLKQVSYHKENCCKAFTNVKFILLSLMASVMWLTAGLIIVTSTLLVSDLGGDIYINYVIINVELIPMYFITMLLCARFGRKWSTLISMILSGIVSGIIGVVLVMGINNEYIIVSLTFLMRGTITVTLGQLYIWTFELLPTSVRLQGLSASGVMMNLGMAGSPFLINILENVDNSTPFFLMFALSVLSLMSGLILPETKNRPSRETLDDLNEEGGFIESNSQFGYEKIE